MAQKLEILKLFNKKRNLVPGYRPNSRLRKANSGKCLYDCSAISRIGQMISAAGPAAGQPNSFTVVSGTAGGLP